MLVLLEYKQYEINQIRLSNNADTDGRYLIPPYTPTRGSFLLLCYKFIHQMYFNKEQPSMIIPHQSTNIY